MIIDRYRAVGLAANPFAVEASAGTGVFVDRGLPDPPPPGSATLVQVIGDKGAGKTTHVRRWRSLVDGPYHYVPRSPRRDRWRRPPVGPIVYADEIDRMPAPVRRAWFRALARSRSTVVAGTHRDLTAPARRAGLAVRTHRLDPADEAILRTFVEQRIDATSLAGGTERALLLDDDDIALVHRESGGNLRVAESLLHVLVAERVDASSQTHLTG